MDYINTSHPSFVGGNKAVELAQQQVKTARMSSTAIKSKVCNTFFHAFYSATFSLFSLVSFLQVFCDYFETHKMDST